MVILHPREVKFYLYLKWREIRLFTDQDVKYYERKIIEIFLHFLAEIKQLMKDINLVIIVNREIDKLSLTQAIPNKDFSGKLKENGNNEN